MHQYKESSFTYTYVKLDAVVTPVFCILFSGQKISFTSILTVIFKSYSVLRCWEKATSFPGWETWKKRTFFSTIPDLHCPRPTIENGRVNYKNRTLGSVARYRCTPPYKAVGSKKRTCRGNGQWDGEKPTCSKYTELCLWWRLWLQLSFDRFVFLSELVRCASSLQ